LVERGNGLYGVLHWALGAFRRLETDGEVVAYRDLGGASVLGSDDGKPIRADSRRYEPWIGWLRDLAAGESREPDYLRALGADFEPSYNLLRYRGVPVRWFEFDRGESVQWRFNPSGANASSNSFNRALQAWNADSASNVRLSYGGTTGLRNGFTCDGASTVLFGDPRSQVDGTFSCNRGGALAAATYCVLTNSTRSFKGTQYYAISEADVVVNDGTECYLRGNTNRADELFTHEVGHGLGIAHSCGDNASGPCNSRAKDDATMRATIHNDGRGAGIRADDRAALRKLYRGGGGGGNPGSLATPSQLRGRATSSTEGTLSWRDNSTGETGFEFWIRSGSGTWHKWLTRPANSTSMTFIDAIPGALYTFQVRAQRGGQYSAFSNKVRVRMPGGGSRMALGAPSHLVARATSRTEGEMEWRDNSSGESEFEIWIRIGSFSWRSWITVAANSTHAVFWDATPGQTYRFQLRARSGSQSSDFSNVSRVTMPD
jgi:hypothetical protein